LGGASWSLNLVVKTNIFMIDFDTISLSDEIFL